MSSAANGERRTSGSPGGGRPAREELPSGFSPHPERPLGGYAVLTGVFATLTASFSVWIHRSGRELPERLDTGDLALITLATHKVSRLIAKERVTSTVRAPFTRYQGASGFGEVEEEARGHGLRRVIGELLICPYCLGLWIGAAFAAGFVVAPRPTRWVASVFTVLFGSDVLNIAYKKLEEA